MKDSKAVGLPQVFLPCDGRVTKSESSMSLFRALAPTLKFFNRGGYVVTLRHGKRGQVSINLLKAGEASVLFSEHVRFMVYRSGANGELVERDSNCSEKQADVYLEHFDGVQLLPHLSGINGLPILRRGKDRALSATVGGHDINGVPILRHGKCEDLYVTPAGYDKVSGLYIAKGLASGEDPSLSHAVQIWVGMLRDFKFKNEGSRSRAAMGLLGLLAKAGGLLKPKVGDVSADDAPMIKTPLLFLEADDPQTGKGYLTRMAAALLGGSMTVFYDQGRGSTGSVGEAIGQAMFDGKPLIVFDNLRGQLTCPLLEGAMTMPEVQVRLFGKGYRTIETEKFSFFATSNEGKTTDDLSARCSIVELLHQPEGYKFMTYPSGRGTVEEMIANPSYFLRAGFVILKEWYKRGCPKTEESRHQFTEWVQPMDYMGQHICGLAPLMDDHQEKQKSLSDSKKVFERLFILEVKKSERMGREWSAKDCAELCIDNEIGIPSFKDNGDPMAGAKAWGVVFGKRFRDGVNTIEIEGVKMTRGKVYKGHNRESGGAYEGLVYMFEVVAPVVTAPKVADVVTVPTRSIVPAPSVAPVVSRFGDDVAAAMSKDSPLARVPDVSSVAPDPVDKLRTTDQAIQAGAGDWGNPTSEVRMFELKGFMPSGRESVGTVARLLRLMRDRTPAEVRLTIDEGLRRKWWCSSLVPDSRNPKAEPKEFLSLPPQTIKPREAHHEHQEAGGLPF